jgi:hypothetical protein
MRSNRIKIHNARQSASKLRSEIALLDNKITAHLAADGLHQIKFITALRFVTEAETAMRAAVEALQS